VAQLAEQINALRPESRLIIQCTRALCEPSNEEAVYHILREGLDWEYVLKTADFPHGVLPLVHNHLHGLGHGVVPESWRERLQECYRKVALKNLYVTRELLRVVQLLNERGIQVVPFKGPILAISAYGNLALRQFCDLDIFIRKEDVENAIGILTSQGYRLNKFVGEQVPKLIETKKDFQLVHHNEEVVVEMHWCLVGRRFPFSLEVAKLWDRLTTVSVSGTPVYSFPPEEMLLYLCVHGSKHLWERLIWVSDVAQMINRTPNLDWERLGQLSDLHGCRRILNLGLILAHELLGARVPADLLSIARTDRMALSLAEQAICKLFNDGERVYRPTEVHRFHINMRERLRDKAVLAYYYGRDYCRVLLTPNREDKDAIALPPRLDFVYYFLRPFRLFQTVLKRQ
jgi:hypothetical protein